jgi:hypothetical protein
MKLIAMLILSILTTTVVAQDLSYPELHVTPRASARIKIEAKREASNTFKSFLPMQISAISTFIAANMLSGKVEDGLEAGDTVDDGKKSAPTIAMGISALWLGATTWASMKYRPYRNFYLKNKKTPYRSKREKLTMERLAEEEINSLKRVGTRMKWISVITNLGLNAMLNDANPDKTDDQKGAKFVASLSQVLAFAPLFFTTHWETVAEEQDKYKKKIYAPVAMTPILMDPTNTYAATGASLIWQF